MFQVWLPQVADCLDRLSSLMLVHRGVSESLLCCTYISSFQSVEGIQSGQCYGDLAIAACSPDTPMQMPCSGHSKAICGEASTNLFSVGTDLSTEFASPLV